MEGNADQQRNLTSSAFTLQPKPFLGSLVLFFGQSFDFLISTQSDKSKRLLWNSKFAITKVRDPHRKVQKDSWGLQLYLRGKALG